MEGAKEGSLPAKRAPQNALQLAPFGQEDHAATVTAM